MDASDAFSRIWAAFDTAAVLPACAWCGRVRIDETWILPPRAALAAIDERHTLSHSICDGCTDVLERAWPSANGSAPERPR